MSWLFSRALVAGYLEDNSLDGEPCAQLSVISTQHPFSWRDKTTDISRLSRFGVTYEVLTDALGEDLLTWFRAGFPVRTSAQPDGGRNRGSAKRALV